MHQRDTGSTDRTGAGGEVPGVPRDRAERGAQLGRAAPRRRPVVPPAPPTAAARGTMPRLMPRPATTRAWEPPTARRPTTSCKAIRTRPTAPAAPRSREGRGTTSARRAGPTSNAARSSAPASRRSARTQGRIQSGIDACMTACPKLSDKDMRCHVFHCYEAVNPNNPKDYVSHCGHASGRVAGGNCPTEVYQ